MHRNQAGGKSNRTLVTGATGFVGGELLITLLRDSTANIICPVRAPSDLAALQRGRDRLKELLGDEAASAAADRVRWLRADLEEPKLGWNAAQWHQVAMNTTEIYHCAASVSFDLPLDEAHRINVGGTQHIFELALAAADRHDNFHRFHHVSTAYVAGITTGRVSSDYLPQDRAGLYRNTYERTKARAERYLRAQASARVPVSIHRPSIIAGNSRTGRTTNWNVLYVPMKMVARGTLPAFPRAARQLVDAVAVDYLVEAMVAFSKLDSLPLESHHLTAGNSIFTVSDLVEVTRQDALLRPEYSPSDTKLLGRILWPTLVSAVGIAARMPKRVGTVRRKGRIALRCLDQCSVYVPYTRVNTIFDASRDHDALRVAGLEMPQGPEYLATIVDYALNSNFGKVTVQPEQVPAPGVVAQTKASAA